MLASWATVPHLLSGVPPPPHSVLLFPRGANDTIFFTTYLNNSCSKYFLILSHISGVPITWGGLCRGKASPPQQSTPQRVWCSQQKSWEYPELGHWRGTYWDTGGGHSSSGS